MGQTDSGNSTIVQMRKTNRMRSGNVEGHAAARDEFAAPNDRSRNLDAVREIASLVNSGSDLNTVFERIVNGLSSHTSWKRCAIMAIDRASGYSVLVTRTDPSPEASVNLPQKWELTTSPSLRVVETNRPVVIEDAQISTEFPGFRRDSIARNYHSVVVLPLNCTDMQSRQMVLSVSSDRCLQVEEEELNFLTTICHLASIAVGKEKLIHAERLMNSKLERTLKIHSSLLERVLSGSSMSTIAGIVESILPDQIIIIDFTSDAFHVANSPVQQLISDREWADIVRGAAASYFTNLVLSAEPTDFRQLCLVDLTSLGVEFSRNAYVEPLQVDGETVGGMIIFPKQRGMNDLDFLIAQEVKFALSVQIMRAHIQLRKDATQIADLFAHLFRKDWTDANQIANRAKRLDVSLALPGHLLAFEVAGLDEKRRGGMDLILRRLNSLLKNARPGAIAFAIDARIFVYLPGTIQAFDKFKATLGRQFLEASQWQLGRGALVSVSPQCDRLEDFQHCYEQCCRLLALGKMADRRGLIRQEDFGPFALLLSGLENGVAQEFMQQTIGQIEKYDREHATDLLATAATFINQGCKYQAAAENLGVHPSTLRYRLQRLAELFHLNLEDAEARFALSLALKLRALFGR